MLWVVTTATAADSKLQQWVERYYHSDALCGNSTVENTLLDASQLRVDLRIDQRWAISMEKFDRQATDNWFAIHCPLPFESVSSVLGERDIVIYTESIGDTPRSMSCRAFSQSLQARRAEQKSKARSRLQSLLDRLGLSG